MPGERPASAKQGRAGQGKANQGTESPSELLDYVVAYAKQETLDPVVRQVKSLGRGIAGALLLAIGTVLLAVGFLRALQAQFGSTSATVSAGKALVRRPALFAPAHTVNPYGSGHPLSGDWSWVPYIAGAVLCIAVAVICVLKVIRGLSK